MRGLNVRNISLLETKGYLRQHKPDVRKHALNEIGQRTGQKLRKVVRDFHDDEIKQLETAMGNRPMAAFYY